MILKTVTPVLVLLTALCTVSQAADYFADPGAGEVRGKWDVPTRDVDVTSEGAVFTGTKADDRVYIRTEQKGYQTQSFVAEVTVKIDASGPLGIAFFGLGEGKADPERFWEPADGAVYGLAVCPTKFTQNVQIFSGSGNVSSIPGPGDGTHRIRFTWDAAQKKALFELDPNWNGQTFHSRLRLPAGPSTDDISARDGHLFFGGAEGVTFSNFSVRAADPQDLENVTSGSVSTNSGGTQNWLPADNQPRNDPALEAVNKHLAPLDGQIRLLACQYQDAKLVASPAFNNGQVETEGAVWKSTVNTEEKDGAIALEATFRLESGSASSAGVAVAFDFLNWNADDYVFAPAMLYNGNKFKIVPEKYPPYIYNPADRPLDMPVTTTNILHLNKDRSPGLVEMKTFNMATPMMGFYNRTAKKGFLVLTDPKTPLGVSGMMVQEDPAKKLLTMVVSAPGVRTQRYNGYTPSARANSGDKGADFNAGDEVSLRFKVYEFAADDLTAFLAKTFEVRKKMFPPTTYRDLIPFSAAAEIIGDHQEANKWFEKKGEGYYVNRLSGSPGHNQLGWGGNPTYSQPPAIQLTPERLRRVGLTWDMMVSQQGKSGLMHAMYHGGVTLGDGFKEAKAKPDIAMVRRTGDVLQGGILQLEAIRAQGQGKAIKPAWENMLRRCADGLVAVYEKYGQFGQTANVETGEMETNGSTSGAPNIGALALASAYFKEPKYLKVAQEAGEMYYQRDLSQGYSGGGPAEILQSPDSESSWALAKSYMELYEVTNDAKWLKYAQAAINMYATWVVSYDYEFPPDSTLGRLGTQTTGSMFASCANNHSSPGMYVDSADFLLKYYRATGDPRYAEFYKDSVHNVMQYINTEHNRIQSHGGIGYVSERVQMSDWEGGGFGTVSDNDSNYAWECLAQLTGLQNPGVYYNTTTDSLLGLDHVQVERVSKDATGTKLKLTNTTPYDAEVKILAETSAQAAKALKHTAYLDWPKVPVRKGQSAYVLISPDGKVSTARP